MRYIYMMRTDRYVDQSGVPYTLYGIDVWRLPDRDARLHCSYPGLFADRGRAEALARSLTDSAPAPEQLSDLIEAARNESRNGQRREEITDSLGAGG